ncbi:MAG: hypothetical protein NTZ20_05450 [Candidatus Levybacteria bacterium]|nr:hypothetical protein [Candidatus Levybacteria bacterium]
MTLHYDFPENITLGEVKNIIKDNPNFILVDKGDYTVANYVRSGNDTHPPVVDRNTAILRELRGLIFDSFTGEVISRRYQKFFNLGEREDVTNIGVSRNHIILTKLDGSLVTAFKSHNDNLYWGTKMGVTDVAEQALKFISDKNNYIEFANMSIDEGFTPIFEWVSNKQRIVLNYPKDDLVLVAMRNNKTGHYLPYEAITINAMRYGINYVPSYGIKRLSSDNLNDNDNTENKILEFKNLIKLLENEEGVVILFDNGHMIKLKSDWYVSLHRAKSLLENERAVVGIVLDNGEDDLYPLLSEEDKGRLSNFSKGLWEDIFAMESKVNSNLRNSNEMNRKDFALSIVDQSPSFRSLSFLGFDKKKIEISEITDIIRRRLGSKRTFDQCNDIIKIKWKEIKLDE